MSRTELGGFPLRDVDKEFMFGLLRRFAALYFTKILGLCLMGNHFHLLVKMLPDNHYTDSAIKARLELFYGKDRDIGNSELLYWRDKLSSLSGFMREIKVNFSCYYNWRHNR